jgi:hypothetical protein
MGVPAHQAAALVTCKGVTADVTLSRARDRMLPFIRMLTHELTFGRRSTSATPPVMHAIGTLRVGDTVTTLCAELAWVAAAAALALAGEQKKRACTQDETGAGTDVGAVSGRGPSGVGDRQADVSRDRQAVGQMPATSQEAVPNLAPAPVLAMPLHWDMHLEVGFET